MNFELYIVINNQKYLFTKLYYYLEKSVNTYIETLKRDYVGRVIDITDTSGNKFKTSINANSIFTYKEFNK